MKVLKKYNPDIKFKIEDIFKFTGNNKDEYIKLGLGISPRDPSNPDLCYFNIVNERNIINETNGIVFNLHRHDIYAVLVGKEIPSVEFYFSLILESTKNFSMTIQEKTKGTHLQNKLKTPVPQLDKMRHEIQKTIDDWKKESQFGLN